MLADVLGDGVDEGFAAGGGEVLPLFILAKHGGDDSFQDVVKDVAQIDRRDGFFILALAQLQAITREMLERTGCEGLNPGDAGVQRRDEELMGDRFGKLRLIRVGERSPRAEPHGVDRITRGGMRGELVVKGWH